MSYSSVFVDMPVATTSACCEEPDRNSDTQVVDGKSNHYGLPTLTVETRPLRSQAELVSRITVGLILALRCIVGVHLTMGPKGTLNAYYSIIFHCYALRFSGNRFETISCILKKIDVLRLFLRSPQHVKGVEIAIYWETGEKLGNAWASTQHPPACSPGVTLSSVHQFLLVPLGRCKPNFLPSVMTRERKALNSNARPSENE
ncbi:hypothetical protein T09_3843 [Trichinella sp. T9]|nr:hypothetical protein T09_3843 [Trichinella sp. T9]